MATGNRLGDLDRVSYEVIMDWNARSRERLLRALIECQAQLIDGYNYSDETLVALVKLAPELEPKFKETCGTTRFPIHLMYRPPCRFDNGTLVPLYASPAEELDALRALDALER